MVLTEQTTDRRELILATALRLFTDRGYFNTTVHDIQKEANVSIGSIYHHFGNKEKIAQALFLEIESMMATEIAKIKEEYQSAHDRCKAVLRFFFEATESNTDALNYMLYAKHTEFMPEAGPVCTSRPFALMQSIVDEGIANGEIKKFHSEIVAVNIFGGAIRLICLRVDGVIDQPLPTFLDEFWECAWNGVAS